MEKSVSFSRSRPRSFTLGTATIGSQNWQNTTLRDIKLCQALVNRSDKNCDNVKYYDSPPNLRDTVAELSNHEAHRYFRDVRAVVNSLQTSSLELNDEIKSLTRNKEALEKALEQRRKDIQLNHNSISIRSARPVKEKDCDGADDLLKAERQHLLNLKRSLETRLQLVQNQLRVLDAARGRVSRVMKERSRVLDLVCQYRSGGGSGRSTPAANSRVPSRQGFTVDPLGAYTPEVEEALREAADVRKESKKLRSDISDVISRTEQLRQAAMDSVNSGLRTKLHETKALEHQLRHSSSQTTNAINRAQRWYDATDIARGCHMGPLNGMNLMTSERPTRPIIKVYQQHPGTQVPEVNYIANSCQGLDESLLDTHQNLQLLRLAKHRMHDNIRQKQHALEVDRSVLRLRRARAETRWTIGGAF